MINGAHVIVYSKNPELDRAFLQEVLGLSHVDVGGGWLIFGLPPAEVAVHPSKKNGVQELYLMCDDVNAFVDEVGKHGIRCAAVQDQGWGLLTTLTLPGGGKLGVYEPRHARPNVHGSANGSRAKTSRANAASNGAASNGAAPARPMSKQAAPKRTSKRPASKQAGPKRTSKRPPSKQAAPKQKAPKKARAAGKTTRR